MDDLPIEILFLAREDPIEDAARPLLLFLGPILAEHPVPRQDSAGHPAPVHRVGRGAAYGPPPHTVPD